MKRLVRGSSTRGQAAVEFALVIGLIVLLMVGLFDLGRVVFAYNGVSHAARDAARAASVDPEDCEAIFLHVQNATIGQRNIVVRVDWEPPSTSNPSQSDVCPMYDETATYSDPSSGAMNATLSPTHKIGGRISVEVQQQVDLMTPLISNIVGGTLTVGSDSTMVATSYSD